jgi:CBS domain-containing protein
MSEISDIMTTEVVTVTPDTSIFDAIEILIANNVAGLPVVDSQERPAGVVTEKDLLMFILKLEKYPSKTKNIKTVKDLMTKYVASFNVHEPIDSLYKCFMKGRFRRVPILSDGKVIGLVSRSDLIKYMMSKHKVGIGAGEQSFGKNNRQSHEGEYDDRN